MSFVLLGILNSQAAGAVGAGDYELLETTVLGSDTASVSFTGLNSTYGSTYKHLQLRITARTNNTGDTQDFLDMTFNGISTSSYDNHFLQGNGSSVFSFDESPLSSTRLLQINSALNPANSFGAIVTDFLDPFDTSKNTTIRSLGGSADNRIGLGSGLFRNTAAIDQISIVPGAGTNLITGSRFSLYGIRAA